MGPITGSDGNNLTILCRPCIPAQLYILVSFVNRKNEVNVFSSDNIGYQEIRF